MLAARAAGTVAAIGATAVLARLVTPGDFGMVAIVLSVFALARCLEEVGLGEATVQRAEISDEQVSTLFWLNACLGLALATSCAIAAPWIARAVGHPDAAPFAAALAPLFLLSALGAQHRALMRRHFRFRPLALAQAASVLTGAVAGVFAATRGAGAWSLVTQHLTAAAVLLAGAWLGSGWKPGMPRLTRGTLPLLRFGAQVTASQFVTALSRNADNILIGRFLGTAALGAYDRAFQLMMLPATHFNQPLTSAVAPALSRLQRDPEAYRALYRAATEVIASVAFPIAVFTAAAAPAIVGVLLGPAWSDAAPILRALAPCGLMLSLNVGTGWVYQSLGRGDRQLRWTLFGSAVALAAIVAGLRWGVLGVAIALSCARVGLRPFGVAYCFHGTFLAPRDLLAGTWRPALAASCAGMAAWLFDPSASGAALRLSVQLAVFLVTGLAAMALLPGGLARIVGARRFLKSALQPTTVVRRG
jgi:PST family polysaccharide transporter